MPTTTMINMFYLGNFADIDTDETDKDVEQGDDLLGDYGRPPTVSVTENDADDDGIIMDDESNAGGDSMTYDIGSGSQIVELDSTSWFEATVTLGDGTTQIVNVGVLQMSNGDVFVRDVNNELDGLNIQNFELSRVANSSYDGSNTTNTIENTRMVCFVQGTQIETENGATPIEQLRVGDKVVTADHGLQSVRWIASGFLQDPGRHAPIEIAQNALGGGMPKQKLRVSPQHRLLLVSRIAQRMFGTFEVLLPAFRLVGIEGISRSTNKKPVRYWHFLTECHELVNANGAWAETLYPGPQALETLAPAAREEIEAILPLFFEDFSYPKARFEPPRPEQKKLVERHILNNKPLIETRRTQLH